MNTHLSLYHKSEVVYFVTEGRVPGGPLISQEPVFAVPVSDREHFVRTFVRMAVAGNPRIAMPTIAELNNARLLRYFRVRSWAALERSATLWCVERVGNQVDIGPWIRLPGKRGLFPAPHLVRRISASAPVDQIANFAYEYLTTYTSPNTPSA